MFMQLDKQTSPSTPQHSLYMKACVSRKLTSTFPIKENLLVRISNVQNSRIREVFSLRQGFSKSNVRLRSLLKMLNLQLLLQRV